MNDIMRYELEKAQQSLEEFYSGLFWYVGVEGCSYGDEYGDPYGIYPWKLKQLYYGIYDDVQKVVELQYKNYKIESFQFLKHSKALENIINASKEYEEKYRPRSSGDVIKYSNKLYTVTGFSDDMFYAISEDGEKIQLNKNNKYYKLIYSDYYTKNKK